MQIEGVATTIPADLAILEHGDFAAITHSTKWVENVLDLSNVGAPPVAPDDDANSEAKVKRETTVEVNGKRFSVTMWVPESAGAPVGQGASGAAPRPRRAAGAASGGGSASGEVAVPMQGTIIKVLVAVGDAVEAGQAVCVLEAMKMENNIAAGKAGTVKEVRVKPGDTVGSGDIVVVIE